jgi:hypothetical protein
MSASLQRAQPARQALRGDQDHAGRDIERRDAHVAHPCQRGRRVVGVQRRQHHVAGLRRLDGDVGGLQVADLADHDDVRILPQERLQRGRKGQAGLVVDVDLVDAGQVDLGGSSAVAMLTPGLFRMFRQVYSDTVLPEPVGPVTRIMP